jgi:hypothetical protein
LLRSSRHQGIAGHPSTHLSEHHLAAALAHVQANASASFSNSAYSSICVGANKNGYRINGHVPLAVNVHLIIQPQPICEIDRIIASI